MRKRPEPKQPKPASIVGQSTMPRPDCETLLALAKTHTPFEIARAYGVMKIIAEGWLREAGLCPAPRCGGLWMARPRAEATESQSRKPTLPKLSMHQKFLADPENLRRKRILENLS